MNCMGQTMGRQAKQIELFESEESELTRLRRRRNTAASLHLRAGIVLDCVKGYSGEDIAEGTVTPWNTSFGGCA